MDLSGIVESLQRGLTGIPLVAYALILLGGPTAALIGYRLIVVARRAATSSSAEAAPFWVCQSCRSVNELRLSRCYRCAIERDFDRRDRGHRRAASWPANHRPGARGLAIRDAGREPRRWPGSRSGSPGDGRTNVRARSRACWARSGRRAEVGTVERADRERRFPYSCWRPGAGRRNPPAASGPPITRRGGVR